MVHPSLLLTFHGSGVDGKLCRTVLVDFQVILQAKILTCRDFIAETFH